MIGINVVVSEELLPKKLPISLYGGIGNVVSEGEDMVIKYECLLIVSAKGFDNSKRLARDL